MNFIAPIRSVLVLGGGSAGFIAALTLKKRLPQLEVTVLRSPAIGIIGVGEGTTPYFPTHFHEYLKIDQGSFYKEAEPIWKLGIRYLWGPQASFNYTFDSQVEWQWPDLRKPNGYYCTEDFTNASLYSAMMDETKVFARQPNGAPAISNGFAWHIENRKLVGWLEAQSRKAGVVVRDVTVKGVERRVDGGIGALQLDDGGRAEADLFVDASGFTSELLGRALEEPFVSFADSLFCDRAVVGGWERTDEPIQAFTTAETMDAGWCWRIDHETIINRGYVFSSAHLSETEAEAEYRAKNPRAGETRVVKFRTGRYARPWVQNVVAVGNASGFVEPLEATALMLICLQSRALADGLIAADAQPTPSGVAVYNTFLNGVWDDVRDFLAIHYRFNQRVETPFWQRCQQEVALHGAEPLVEYYQENGPNMIPKSVLLNPNSPFGLEGYYTLLLGQGVPFARRHRPAAEEMKRWEARRGQFAAAAKAAMNVEEALRFIRDPRWRWR